jgi:predicted metal-dependent hydrolase
MHEARPGERALTVGPPTTMGTPLFVRSPRARRYRLTLQRDGTAVVTMPPHGSQREAERFVAAHSEWLARARERQSQLPRAAEVWRPGTHVLWRGEQTMIRVTADAPDREVGSAKGSASLRPDSSVTAVCLAADVFRVRARGSDLRPALEAQFTRCAKVELPARAWELAAETGADMKNVTVRNQRSRWGSCSARGTVSLNWRLVQTPEAVRDYIIYHELAHLQEMNHSERFWARVTQTCPNWREAERWLKHHSNLVGL